MANVRRSPKQDLEQFYIDTYCENRVLIEQEDLLASDEPFIYFDELKNYELNSFPYAFIRDHDKKLRCYMRENCHTLGVGYTGCGKTTYFISLLAALSERKNKPDIIITDPKGEIYNMTYDRFKRLGYRIYIFNLKDSSASDCWNPLDEIWNKWQDYCKASSDIKVFPPIMDLEGEPIDVCFDVPTRYIYKDKEFATKKEAERAMNTDKSMLYAQIDSQINSLGESLITVTSKNDQTWERGARDYLKGLIWLLLEESIEDDTLMTKDKFNFMSILNLHTQFRNSINRGDSGYHSLTDRILCLKNKSADSKAKQLLTSVLDNATSTRSCYWGVFESSTAEMFFSDTLLVTACTTIDVTPSMEVPTVTFICTKDYDTSNNRFAELFIDHSYRQRIEYIDKNCINNQRDCYYVLDEFTNIPKINDIEGKITISRSRRIWFMFMVQSQANLVSKYEDYVATTINDNCLTTLFWGSNNHATCHEFSESCGRRTIFNPLNDSKDTIPLVPISRVEGLKPHQLIIRNMGKTILVENARHYQDNVEFEVGDSFKEAPRNKNDVCYLDKKYVYIAAVKGKKEDPFFDD